VDGSQLMLPLCGLDLDAEPPPAGEVFTRRWVIESALVDAGLGAVLHPAPSLPLRRDRHRRLDTPIQEAADGGQSGRSRKKGR